MNAELERTKTSHQETLTRLLDMEAAISALENELKDSQQRLDEAEMSLVTAQEERSVQQFALYKLQKQIKESAEKYSEEVQNLHSLVSELEHQNSSLNEQLAGMKSAKLIDDQSSLDLTSQKTQEAKVEISRSQEMFKTAQKEIASLKGHLSQMEAREKVLLAEKGRVQEIADQINTELVKCTVELRLVKENEGKALSEISSLRESAQKTSTAIDQLQRENQEFQEAVNNASLELARTVKENQAVKEESSAMQDELTSKIAALTGMCRQSEKVEKELSEKLIKSQETANSSATRLTEALQEMDSLKSELKDHRKTQQMVIKP